MCIDCGLVVTVENAEAFDFDHVVRADKDANVAAVKQQFGRVLREMSKCVLRCSNCHRLKSRRSGDYTPIVRGSEQSQESPMTLF